MTFGIRGKGLEAKGFDIDSEAGDNEHDDDDDDDEEEDEDEDEEDDDEGYDSTGGQRDQEPDKKSNGKGIADRFRETFTRR